MVEDGSPLVGWGGVGFTPTLWLFIGAMLRKRRRPAACLLHISLQRSKKESTTNGILFLTGSIHPMR